MSEKEWEKLFELIGKAVHQEGMTSDEKVAQIKRKMGRYNAEIDVMEFVACVEDD